MKSAVLYKPIKKIFLISCVGQKLGYGAVAKDLYISEWFRKAWAYCQQRSDMGTETYILSAKYGLLWSEDFVDPYEMSLLNMPIGERKKWASRVLSSLEAMEKLNGLQVVILAGEKYREFLVPSIEDAGAIVKVPMDGLGIGQQLSYLKKNTREEDRL